MFARYQAYRHDSQKALLGFFFLAKKSLTQKPDMSARELAPHQRKVVQR
jgi:hypothetical protein